MRRSLRTVVPLVVTLAVATVLAGCAGADEEPGEATRTATPSDRTSDPSPESPPETASDPEDTASTASGPPQVVDTAATGLEVPWGIDFLPDGTALVTERDTARVLAVRQGKQPREVGRIDQAAPQGEAGLLGLAVSPDFTEDRSVFLYVTTAQDNRVVRARYDGGQLEVAGVVLSGIPAGFTHDGGRLLFDEEGHLLVSTGETGQPDLAQDRSSLAGKILRITTDGEPAPDNPDPESAVLSWGHRNVQGLAFDDDGNLWASEFGSDEFDELNLIEPGNNYGWPQVEGRGGGSDLVNPRVVWSTDDASPSGLAHTAGHAWLGALRGQRLWRVPIEDGRAGEPRDFFVGDHGRMRSVTVAPDGNLWVTTSNRDGRGDPRQGDDKILVVSPGS